ncbi:uncharacterized protein LOC123228729 [Mangifera indica]|uniref:uncharacterized protein LOC123228729 n=1 Tax=Mangifera indica TaxID=29780 RepID=UPI001CFAB5BF|nr:uncharacterized protein LOC123228729 [Mangifera indica]
MARAQHRIKMFADKKRTERRFDIGDWVYLKLQPYRQTSLHQGCPKLQARYYDPFQIVDKVGAVAYKLQLPTDAKIHNMFHVSLLKPAYAFIQSSSTLPPRVPLSEHIPQAVLDRRMFSLEDKVAEGEEIVTNLNERNHSGRT